MHYEMHYHVILSDIMRYQMTYTWDILHSKKPDNIGIYRTFEWWYKNMKLDFLNRVSGVRIPPSAPSKALRKECFFVWIPD